MNTALFGVRGPRCREDTLARKLREKTHPPLHYPDMIWHLPGRRLQTFDTVFFLDYLPRGILGKGKGEGREEVGGDALDGIKLIVTSVGGQWIFRR